jgi:2'-5' RNA ligase
LRAFFALVPDPATQRALGIIARDVAAHAGGRAIADANLHLTLAFIGDVMGERIDVLRTIVVELPRPAFALTLDRIGTFKRSELAWIAPSLVPMRLTELESALTAALKTADFVLETRPFHAHVTLARRCTKRIAKVHFGRVEWDVRRVALLASIAGNGGVCYRELAGLALD